MHQQTQHLFRQFSEEDPKQLKQVIEALIAKSRVLISNLQETWQRLQQSQAEKSFWKESYFNLRQACEHYVDSNGLTPFNYIVSLQEELKKEKVYKSCLQEKFKVMKPNSTSNQKPLSAEISLKNYEGQKKEVATHGVESSLMKQSLGVRHHHKHRIGPKSIEFFKFKEQQSQ